MNRPRSASMGSGLVYYHVDRPIVHFGNVGETQYRPASTHTLQITQELPRERPSH